MSEPIVSIIVPVYQCRDYISECIESLVAQTYKYLDIILVDDGSSDGSEQICDLAAVDDSRIRVIHQENQGVSSARNNGMKVAKGDYLMFVDSDDWLEHNCCELCVYELKKNDADVCFFEMNIEREGTRKQTQALADLNKYTMLDELLCRSIPFKNSDSEDNMVYYGPYCKMYRKSVLDGLEFNRRLKYGEDAIFNYQAICKIKKYTTVSASLYHYRKNNTSVTALFSLDRNAQTILRLKETWKTIEQQEHHSKRQKKAFEEMFVNISLWIINHIFVGRKYDLQTAWNEYSSWIYDNELRLIWNQIKESQYFPRILRAMFSENRLIQLLVFVNLRYLKRNCP